MQDRLQVHDLPREELRHGEPDNVRRSGCVSHDPADLGAAKAVRLGSQALHNLVAVDGVDIYFSDIKKFVISTTLTNPTWKNTTVVPARSRPYSR